MLEQRQQFANPASQGRRYSLDPGMRRMIFGPIRPMERPSLLERLLGR